MPGNGTAAETALLLLGPSISLLTRDAAAAREAAAVVVLRPPLPLPLLPRLPRLQRARPGCDRPLTSGVTLSRARRGRHRAALTGQRRSMPKNDEL